MFMLDGVEWRRLAEVGGTLAVCGGRLVWVGGGWGSKEVMELRGGRWSLMTDMLVGCRRSCVLGVMSTLQLSLLIVHVLYAMCVGVVCNMCTCVWSLWL